MNSEVRNYVADKAKSLLSMRGCCAELKEALQEWLGALDTADERAKTEKLIAELEEDVMSVDDMIEFGKSEFAASLFGAEKAAEFAASGVKAKAEGITHCVCDACSAGYDILSKKAELLG